MITCKQNVQVIVSLELVSFSRPRELLSCASRHVTRVGSEKLFLYQPFIYFPADFDRSVYYQRFTVVSIILGYSLSLQLLRAIAYKYRESHGRKENSDFLSLRQKDPFGELFSEIYFQSSSEFSSIGQNILYSFSSSALNFHGPSQPFRYDMHIAQLLLQNLLFDERFVFQKGYDPLKSVKILLVN